MQWSPKYSTGISSVDAQHKLLFRMSADFQAALDEGGGERVYGDLLTSLELYTRNHFRHEEGCMAKHLCPVADVNKLAHAQFTETLAGYKARYDSGGFERGEAERLMQYIETWLTNHICRIDVRLREHVTQETE